MLQKQNVSTFFNKNYSKKYLSIKTKIYEKQPFTKRAEHMLCKFFVHNKCKRGDECDYSHNISKFSDEQILKILNERIEEQVDSKTMRKDNFVIHSPFN